MSKIKDLVNKIKADPEKAALIEEFKSQAPLTDVQKYPRVKDFTYGMLLVSALPYIIRNTNDEHSFGIFFTNALGFTYDGLAHIKNSVDRLPSINKPTVKHTLCSWCGKLHVAINPYCYVIPCCVTCIQDVQNKLCAAPYRYKHMVKFQYVESTFTYHTIKDFKLIWEKMLHDYFYVYNFS